MPLVLLIIWPLAELLVAIEVAGAIGIGLTLLLLLASFPVGTAIVRSRGRALARSTVASLAAGQAPGREALDRLLGVLAGVLVLIPGFITDVIALALLAGPGRAAARALLRRHAGSRAVRGAARFATARRPYDADTTAREQPAPRLPS